MFKSTNPAKQKTRIVTFIKYVQIACLISIKPRKVGMRLEVLTNKDGRGGEREKTTRNEGENR
jgi:hypothetical protein